MVELVKSTKNGILTDSYLLSEKFGKKHEYIVRKTEQLILRLGARKFATKNEPVIVESFKFYRGQEFRYFRYDKKAFSLLVMGFTGDKAFEWQEKFYDAFAAMETALLNHESPEWRQVRNDSKLARLEFTDTVKLFVQYCKEQGSQNSDRYYGNLTKMEYSALRLIEYREKVPSNFRDTLNRMQLHMLVMAEHVANETIKQGMEDGLHYKEIFILAKQAVLRYAGTVLFDKIIEEPCH
jgi:Rha family phage regulatory protein